MKRTVHLLRMTAHLGNFAAVMASALLGNCYAIAGEIARTAPTRGIAHAATISSGVAMAFASTRPGSVMATTTARIGAMSSIVKEGVLSTSLGVTVELAFLSELVATEHGNVQMARMKTSARRPLAGLTSSGVVAAVA